MIGFITKGFKLKIAFIHANSLKVQWQHSKRNEINMGSSNTTQLKFEKFIKVTKAVYSYTELELLAEFGGYVGLFLGISVFHVSQVVDKILDKLMTKY